MCGQALARLGSGAIIGRHGRVSSGERGDDGIDLGRIQGAVVHEALQHLAKLGLALGRIAVTAAVTTTVMLASDVTVGSIDRRRGCTAISARVGTGVGARVRRRNGHRTLGAGASGQVHQQSGAGTGDQSGGDAENRQLLRRVLRCVHVVCSFVSQVRFTCVHSDCAS